MSPSGTRGEGGLGRGDASRADHPTPTTAPVPARLSTDGTAVIVLDQTALPEREVERTLRTIDDVEEAIRSLRVRGAPLIGITAALGVAALARAAVEAPGAPEAGEVRTATEAEPSESPTPAATRRRGVQSSPDDGTAPAEGRESLPLADRVRRWCRRLSRARPTAVNLGWALARMEGVVDRGADAGAAHGDDHEERQRTDRGERRRAGHGDAAGDRALADRLEAEARAIHAEDRAMCRRIGEHALELLGGAAGDLTVLTHCNTGALATGGIGTALAPVYLAHAAGRRVRVFADETRPLLQGSRLTAWELRRAGVDVTVLADGTAGALMAADRRPDAVLVGADRIAANGDVANKVGTYGLAVLARHHGVPFYVLAPTTTVDLATPDGAGIPIEHRDPDEVRRGFGRLTAPEDAPVWSPAFDVTPAELVTAIVTEQGLHRAPFPEALREAVEAAEEERRGSRAGGRAEGAPHGAEAPPPSDPSAPRGDAS